MATSAIAGKSARPCHNCIKKRARWYCSSDDAFLCPSCDASVHSANPLAARHHRILLKSAPPTWHHGFTRKARTPRRKKHGAAAITNRLHLVPEICGEDNQSIEDNDDQEPLLYRVPIFEPLSAELCTGDDTRICRAGLSEPVHEPVNQTLPSEMDLAEFAADVESLLGKGLEDESFDMEGLGILGELNGRVKIEDEESNPGFDYVNNFHYDSSPMTGFELGFDCKKMNTFGDSKKGIFLRLDYENVLSSWDEKKSPWTTGQRPDLDFDECMGGLCGGVQVYGAMGQVAVMVDGGREARVSRYREKRRTRLFSKKIRYEVRKLNAEKRPRMKGRFVKRANFAFA